MAFFSSERLEEYKTGKALIQTLRSQNNKTLIIHYSCESFFNLNGRTPRITSICVKNRSSQTTKTFSIHLEAQIKGMQFSSISDIDYDLLEGQMLRDFFKYMKSHNTFNWVHWNMKNASFGFEAISNRYKILGGYPKDIEDQFKFDLVDLISKIYTNKFEKHEPNGQLLNLAERNKISKRDALKGKDEADAFDNKDYLKLHMSTSRKVDIIDQVLTLEEQGKLKVETSFWQIYGITPVGVFEMIRNNWILFLLWSILVYLLGAAFEPIVQKYFGTN